MKVETWPIARPIPYPNNPRAITPAGLAKIAESLREFGFRQPIVVDKDGVVVVGHTRLRAAREILKLDHVPVHVALDLTPEQAAAYRLADNRTNEEATWVDDMLATEMELLKQLEVDLALTGFNDDEIRKMLDTGSMEELAEETPPVPVEATSRAGDVWLLGNHRLICGDATDRATVERVLNGVKPHLMVTDPPYGVEYDANWRNVAVRDDGSKIGGRATGKVLNDDRADWREAWALFPGSVAYVWHAGIRSGEVESSLRAAGFKPRAQIVWVKPRFAIGRGDYHWQHEPCSYATRSVDDAWTGRYEPEHEVASYVVKPNAKGHYAGGRKQSTVWNIEHRKSETGHSTQKPIECMRRPIENNSSEGQAIYEPFSGSGTTLIACELTGRHCYASELNPGYVDVAVMRWQHTTGRKATLEGDGRTFDEIVLARRHEAAEASAGELLEAAE